MPMAIKSGRQPMMREEVVSAHGGIDRYLPYNRIRKHCAYTMTNVKALSPHTWRKRYEPSLIKDLEHDGVRPNGMSEWTDSSGTVRLVVALDGAIHFATGESSWDHATVVGGITISTANPVRFAQYDGTLYGVDGVIYFKVYNDAGTVKVARVLQPSTNGPIEPGSITVYDSAAPHPHDVLTDSALDGNLLTGASADKGDIDYDTSKGSIESGFIAGDCTIDYSRGVLKTDSNFARADQDGKLIYHSLLHKDVGEVVLTDGTNSTESCIKDAALGHLEHTSATFTARATLTATYKHTTDAGKSEVFSYYNVPDEPLSVSYSLGGVTSSNPVKKGSFSDTYATDDGDGTLSGSGVSDGIIDYDSGAVSYVLTGLTAVEWPIPQLDITAGWDEWDGVVSTPETVGKANADGKFYLEVLYPACISGRMTLNDGAKSVVAVGADLFDGETDVGGWTASTGAVSVSEATFTAGAMIDATYYNKTSVTGESITDPTDFVLGSATTPSGPTDLVWTKNKMWLACGKLLYKSDSTLPETFSTAPNELKGGKGVEISRLIQHRADRIIAFKGDGSSSGSIHPIDVSSYDTAQWTANNYFDDVSLCSPSAIVRADQREAADIFIPKREGVCTLATSDVDNVTGTDDPIDKSIQSLIGTPTNAQLLASWAVMFENEYLRWINDKVYALNLSVPRENLNDGWTYIDMATSGSVYGCEADCGCVCDFGSGPRLYIGGDDGKIKRMFAGATTNFTATYEGAGLAPTLHDRPTIFLDSVPYKVGVRVASNATTGLYQVLMVDENGTVYTIGSNNVGTAVATTASDVSERFSVAVPVGAYAVRITFAVTKVNATFAWDEVTLTAPSGATEVLDYASVSNPTTTGATIELVGPPSQSGWVLSGQVRCIV